MNKLKFVFPWQNFTNRDDDSGDDETEHGWHNRSCYNRVALFLDDNRSFGFVLVAVICDLDRRIYRRENDTVPADLHVCRCAINLQIDNQLHACNACYTWLEFRNLTWLGRQSTDLVKKLFSLTHVLLTANDAFTTANIKIYDILGCASFVWT